MTIKSVSVIGLGKLGTPLLAAIAQRGFNVIGVDINPEVTAKINRAKSPVNEPHIDELLKKYRQKIEATDDYHYAVHSTDVSFIIVPTPSTKNGGFTNKYVISATQQIAKALSSKKTYHLVCVTSTVLPFSMDREIVTTLKQYSKKKASKDFGLCYNPEFIALGSVVDNLLKPDFVLIGQLDKKSGDILSEFYEKFCINNPPIARMNFINAEIAKIALNSYITTKISFANSLAVITQKIPGASIDQITSAIGLDQRIGAKYLKGAAPYGGPCFPRDNRAFAHFAKSVKAKAPIAEATDLFNRYFSQQLADKIAGLAKKKDKVAILGLAYKPNTDVAEESAGIKIANRLVQNNIEVVAWDRAANQNAKLYISPKVKIAKSLRQCLSDAKIIVITTPWDQFRKLKIPNSNPKPILIDCWRILDPLKYQKVASYKTIGVGGLSL